MDEWMDENHLSCQMGFLMRGEPYGDESARQPDNLRFNLVHTHTHANALPYACESSLNTCYTGQETSITAVTRDSAEHEPSFKPIRRQRACRPFHQASTNQKCSSLSPTPPRWSTPICFYFCTHFFFWFIAWCGRYDGRYDLVWAAAAAFLSPAPDWGQVLPPPPHAAASQNSSGF